MKREAMDQAAANRTVRETLCASLCCSVADLERDGVVIHPFRALSGRFRYPVRDAALCLASVGRGIVGYATGNLLDQVRSLLAETQPEAVFSIATLAELSALAAQHDQVLAGPALRWVCSADTLRPAGGVNGVSIELHHRDEMEKVYRYAGFRYALSYQLDHERPDMVAAVALEAGEVVGIAGASADSDRMWQIGVGVRNGSRRKGIGAALVSEVTKAVLEQGRVPFYSTWISNIGSNNLARSLGYRYCWTDVYSTDRR